MNKDKNIFYCHWPTLQNEVLIPLHRPTEYGGATFMPDMDTRAYARYIRPLKPQDGKNYYEYEYAGIVWR